MAGLLPLASSPLQAPPPSTDYYAALKPRNLSSLWYAAQRTHPDKAYGQPFAIFDPIGFIGPNYQRFYLHWRLRRGAWFNASHSPLVLCVAGC